MTWRRRRTPINTSNRPMVHHLRRLISISVPHRDCLCLPWRWRRLDWNTHRQTLLNRPRRRSGKTTTPLAKFIRLTLGLRVRVLRVACSRSRQRMLRPVGTKDQRRGPLLQLVRGRLFDHIHRWLPGDQRNQCHHLVPPQFRLKHRHQFGQNRVWNDRNRIILRDPRFKMPRL